MMYVILFFVVVVIPGGVFWLMASATDFSTPTPKRRKRKKPKPLNTYWLKKIRKRFIIKENVVNCERVYLIADKQLQNVQYLPYSSASSVLQPIVERLAGWETWQKHAKHRRHEVEKRKYNKFLKTHDQLTKGLDSA
jgi:hypothetical protein